MHICMWPSPCTPRVCIPARAHAWLQSAKAACREHTPELGAPGAQGLYFTIEADRERSRNMGRLMTGSLSDANLCEMGRVSAAAHHRADRQPPGQALRPCQALQQPAGAQIAAAPV